MLAIAPHKRGAIFLSTVDGRAGYAQNSPEQFLDRLEVSRTAKARPIGLPPPVAVFYLDEDFLFRPRTNATKKKTTKTLRKIESRH